MNGLALILAIDCRTSSSRSSNASAGHSGLIPVSRWMPLRKSSSANVSISQSVWWISMISSVPSSRCEMARERISSSVTTPPAFRITCASPSLRPSPQRSSARSRIPSRSTRRLLPREAAPEADLRGGAQVCGGQTRVKPSNAPDATIVVATSHKLVTVEAISRRRDLWAVASRCGKEVRVRRVLVVLLILGATVGVSPALAAHGKKPSSPGHHPSGVVVDQRAIAIIAK
jgi:hypothetical protein